MNTFTQFIRFVAVGVGALLVLLLGTHVLTEYAGLWYFWAFLISAMCNWTLLFFAHAFFTFSGHKKGGYAGKYATFISTYFVGFVINVALVYCLTTILGLQYLFSIALAAGITTSITFTISKMLIFTYGHQD